jgi:choline dehydrogenase-like flavoprotein
MFIDARSLGQNTAIQTCVCIIGAGAAGITLALSLRSAEFPVAVLESGDFEFDEATQDLDTGEVIGLPAQDLYQSRLRFFGGTTNHWGGMCRPLDEEDFQVRDGIPLSGWPIRRADLLPYYREAQRLCELGTFEYDPGYWSRKTGQAWPKFDPARLKIAISQLSPPTRFGQTWREALRQSDTVTVYLNANAVNLQANATASSVDRIDVACLSGPGFSVQARYVVLAAGALENARVLLLSTGVQSAGLGNTNDLVGRYFMDHPYFPWAAVARFATPDAPLPYVPTRPGAAAFGTLAPGDAAQSAKGAGGFQVWLAELHRFVDGVDSLKTVGGALQHFSLPAHLWEHLGNILRDRTEVADTIYRSVTGQRSSPFSPSPYQQASPTGSALGASMDFVLEQAPNPVSRVMLSPERDALGQNRLRLDWRLSEVERRTYNRARALVALEFGRLGIGRVNVKLLPDDGWPPELRAANHHLGTTRMSADPKTGVVDANCRVHGVGNLYVVGGSVFATSGYAHPTLTIVALAARLGDELRRLMV